MESLVFRPVAWTKKNFCFQLNATVSRMYFVISLTLFLLLLSVSLSLSPTQRKGVHIYVHSVSGAENFVYPTTLQQIFFSDTCMSSLCTQWQWSHFQDNRRHYITHLVTLKCSNIKTSYYIRVNIQLSVETNKVLFLSSVFELVKLVINSVLWHPPAVECSPIVQKTWVQSLVVSYQRL